MTTADSALTGIFSTPAVDRELSLDAQVRAMARFEWALAAALEEARIAPAGTAKALEPLRDTFALSGAQLEKLQGDARWAGNIAIPLIKLFTDFVAQKNNQAARYVHLGATSQDLLDTALVLQLTPVLQILQDETGALIESCSALARKHAETVMAGRTWLQQGPPITFGLKVAGWAAAMARHQQRLGAVAERALVLQFGGAVGTLASLGDNGSAVSAALARNLQLREPLLPWHTQRDNLAEVATTLGLLVGTVGKMARDISLLMQIEVAEAFEPAVAGRGGSSTMPHKRNPVACAGVLAIATRVPYLVATMLSAMVQEHERALGGWQAEWETLPAILRLSASALAYMRETIAGLEVDASRMSENLKMTHGAVLAEAVSSALAPALGREQAHALLEAAVQQATREKRTLREVLLSTPEVAKHLRAEKITALTDPENYLGSTRALIERTLAAIPEKK
jgi:3-carboxy-cis,cis-muconate cycloisomerase